MHSMGERIMNLWDLLDPDSSDSEEIARFKSWANSYLLRNRQLVDWTDRPHETSAENLVLVLLGTVSRKSDVAAIADAVLMGRTDPRIPESLHDHFLECKEHRLEVVDMLREYAE